MTTPEAPAAQAAISLKGVSRRFGEAVAVQRIDLELARGEFFALLGPSGCGKTTTLRMIGGSELPTTGRISLAGADVTMLPPHRRDVNTVFQSYALFPHLTVLDNVTFGLRRKGVPKAEAEKRAHEYLELVGLEGFGKRRPLQLSGGQQQRTAIARALVKGADLVLLDEPLANLDYKLREELRTELPKIFEASGAIFVYATTEPSEALLLGGRTACLWEGEVLQFGETPKVYRQPDTLKVAEVFSDPPLNTVGIEKKGDSVHYAGGVTAAASGLYAPLADGRYRIGFRAHQLGVGQSAVGGHVFPVEVTVTEITGSESFIHVKHAETNWVSVLQGIHEFVPGDRLDAVLDPANLFVFDSSDRLVAAPAM